MPTPVFICGAECGIAVAGTAGAGVEHWSSAAGPAITVVTSGPSSMLSTRCFRCFVSGVADRAAVTHTFAAAIGSPATTVAKFDLYFATLPTTDVDIFSGGGAAGLGLVFTQSDSTLRAMGAAPANQAAGGFTVTTGVWYRIDLKLVYNTTCTADLQVNGNAQTQYSVAGAAATNTGFTLGTNLNPLVGDYYIDNLEVSGTSADYPLGASVITGLYPTADGTHGGGWASGVFGKGAAGTTAAANTDTDLWTNLQNPLSTTAGNRIGDLTGTSLTNYVEILLGNLPANADQVHGQMFVATTHSATATTSQFNLQYTNAASAGPITLFAGDFSESTITIPIFVRNTDPAGSALTVARVNDTELRFSSTDSNPDVFLDGVCCEVAYTETVAAAPAIVAATKARRR